MASGIKRSCNRPKASKATRASSQRKRKKGESEATLAYRTKVLARRAKKKQKKNSKGKKRS